VRLPELVGRRVLNLELLERLCELGLDVCLCPALHLESRLGARDGRLDAGNVALELLLGLVPRRELLVCLCKRLCVLNHLVDLGRRQAADRVGNGDVCLAARRLVLSRDLEQTVGVDLECADELGLASRLGRNAGKLKLAEKPVLLARHTLALVDGEGDGGLVVLNGGEGSGLVGRNGRVSGHDDTEDVTLHGDTERERRNVEEEEVGGLVRGLSGEDGGLDGGTVRNGLVRVDGLVERAATEELGDERLDLRDTGGTTDEDNVVDLVLCDLGILQDLVDRGERVLEGRGVDLLESRTRDRGREVGSREERVDLDGGLSD